MYLPPWKRVSWVGIGGSAHTTIGCGATAVGTYSVPSQATTNMRTKINRMLYTSTAAANSTGGIRNTTHGVILGSSATEGGFQLAGIVSFSTAVAQQRGFFGVIATAAALTSINPTGNVNCIGYMYNSSSGNWSIGHNDGAGLCTQIDLGTGCPINTTDPHLMVLSAVPGATLVDYYIKNLSTNNVVTGQLGTGNLPANTTYMWAQLWAQNGSTASAVGVETAGFTLISDQ
jgi:hypothetical protein